MYCLTSPLFGSVSLYLHKLFLSLLVDGRHNDLIKPAGKLNGVILKVLSFPFSYSKNLTSSVVTRKTTLM